MVTFAGGCHPLFLENMFFIGWCNEMDGAMKPFDQWCLLYSYGDVYDAVISGCFMGLRDLRVISVLFGMVVLWFVWGHVSNFGAELMVLAEWQFWSRF